MASHSAVLSSLRYVWEIAPPSRGLQRHPATASWAKRGLDIALAGTILVALSPLLILLAAAIRLTSRGPALFVQQRVGAGGDLFSMLKFRTMACGAEQGENGLARRHHQQGFFKIENDPRITPLGRFLRRSSLDELPQLVNVLRGEMSLVGPRPLLVRDVESLVPRLPSCRFAVRPGLTGLWQVNGRSTCTDEERMRYDASYVNQWTLRGDFQLLARTIPTVLSGRGAC
jgi:lipopolysaccharide/colanic/teichoic acid biosynthesis glycosyltransferase